jgi:hypothetical protein
MLYKVDKYYTRVTILKRKIIRSTFITIRTINIGTSLLKINDLLANEFLTYISIHPGNSNVDLSL